ncbi:protein white-like [Coccinella septempunctata]|uniref:protein white-like n=1 Tax=Coccinella septempunctata TaxID=41139 RepID=UPI001D06A5C7|nr:protein white-like [Coccinella septempunctata]XP_044756109.1 protein white-like [Coccinella septempunctata]XP_044756110.1 protein white-like [Coccinella septempunctata]
METDDNLNTISSNGSSTKVSETSGSSGEYAYEISDFALKTWKTNSDEGDPTGQVPEDNQIALSWCHINVYGSRISANHSTNVLSAITRNETKEKSHILKDVSGSAKAGEFLVIMGSSGAGKTTLLNCLTFRNLKGLEISGLVCMNNVPTTQAQLAANSAYVQQDDLFIGYLTVKEQLLFQSLVRMDAEYTMEERKQRVEEVMIELALKKCENCQIGVPGIVKGISGGERKRLALAGEFLTNPSILFCDEPTTGLDSFMSLNVVQLLKDISRTGRTVISTIHQPSSELFLLFDKLCLMAQGRTAFLGTTTEAETFFTKLSAPCPLNFNPADHYIQILSIIPGCEENCKRSIKSICDAFESSSLGIQIRKSAKKIVKDAEKIDEPWIHKEGLLNPYRVGWLPQFWALLWRSWLSVIKNPAATKRRFVLVFIETLIITIIYFGQKLNQSGIVNLDGVFFYLLVSTSYQNVFGVVNTLCGEIPLFVKEHKDGMYRTDVYYLTKVITVIPVSVFLACLNTTMCYYAVGLNPEVDRYLTAVCLTILVCLCGQGLGFIISTVSPSFELAPPIVSIVVSPLLMLGGIFLNFRSIPGYLQWLSDLSWFKFAFEAYMINQWSNVAHIECHQNSSANSICLTNGIDVLHKQFISLGEFWPAISALIFLALMFRVVGFFILLFRVSNDE